MTTMAHRCARARWSGTPRRVDAVDDGGDSTARMVMVTSTSREVGVRDGRRRRRRARSSRARRRSSTSSRVTARRAPRAIRDEDGRFARVLFDYGYFDDRHAMEGEVESNAETIELDEELRLTSARFWRRIGRRSTLRALASGFHAIRRGCGGGGDVSETMETVLSDEDGKQCVMEALAMFGLILKILDRVRMIGPFRRRGGGALSRARGREELPNAEEIVALCARTGYDAKTGTRPEGYPETYFARSSSRDARVVNLHGHRAFAHGRRVQSHSALPESRASLHGARGAGRVAVRHTVLGADVVASRHAGVCAKSPTDTTRMGGSSPAALGSPRTC